jgi:hypothetical protein
MPVRFVLDENLRGPPWLAIQQHNASGGVPIDAVRVGDPPDLPLGTDDPDLLLWAEREGRILVTADEQTMIAYLRDHWAAGHHSPGLFLLRRSSRLRDVVDHLEMVTIDGDEVQWRDQIEFIP